MIKGQRHTAETLARISESQKKRYSTGKVFGFQKGHKRFTKNLHAFSLVEIKRSHHSSRLNGTEGGKGTKRPDQTGPNHFNWKGGYENKLMLNRRRRALHLGATGSHTLEEWEALKKAHGYMCLACGKHEPEITLTEDHKIPLSKGGSDFIDNIQPLCQPCNSSKNDRLVSFPFLAGQYTLN